MSHDIIVLIAGCLLWAFGLLCGTFLKRNRYTKASTPASHNTGMLADAQICQDIVEDQLNYLILVGLDFKDGEMISVRDSLYRIVAGKLQHT